ncbi:MAG: hypothetical protein IKZ23_00020, partial [Clostridia bacterium]|nr:hypothetical protein [Clostridia bacterium]
MKRTVAIILAAVMMLGIIPASFMSVFAHGTGVGMNNIGNLSIDNTVGEKIAATVNVDGKYNDTAWKYEDWNIVTAQTGLWSVTLPKNGSFGYKYQLHTDYQYIYGVFVIDTNAVYSGSLGDITVWINTGSGDRYTDKIVLTADGTCTVYGMYEETADKGAGKVTKTLCAKNTENGVLTIEFRTLVSNVTESVGSVMQSYVSVELGGETLWYPRFQAEGDTDINPAASWPKNSVEISKWDITAANHAGGWGSQNADFSNIAPSEIHVDGELNEGIWESFTDYFITSGDGFDYRNNSTHKDEAGYNFTNLSVGYSNSMYYWASESSASHKSYEQSPLRFKYDLRATEKYLYGAVLAYVDTNSTEFYNELKTADKSKTHVVPMWFNILFNAGTRSGNEEQYHTLRVKYNTEVKYDHDKGVWLPTFNYGDGKSETDFARVYAGGGGFVNIDGGNDWSKYAQATRLNRYLIGLEFKLPLAALGILDESTGLYRNSVTNKFDKTEFTFNNVVCASNVENMYHKYPQHLYGSATAAYNAGSYAWHAWSVGSGLNVSRPVVASKNSQFTDPGIFTIDGHISTEYFANLNAADTIINSMGRGSGFAGKNDDVTDGIVGTYYHELTMDSDYLYGAAIIIDGDGKWDHKTASSGNNHDVFRIWIKNQGRTYGEPYDYVLNFFISDVVNTDYGSVAVANIYKRDISHEIAHPIATSVSLSQKSGINTDAGENRTYAYYSDTAANLAGHGIEVEMRTVTHSYRLISGSVKDTVNATSAEMCVLEFKIPLDLIGVEPQTATDKQYEAFSYATSVEVLGNGGASGLCWPLLDNSNISNTEPIDKMNLSKWNCTPNDTAYVYYTDKGASTIVIDGVSDEEIWNNGDERINVSTTTGTWQNIPTGKEYFDYQYKVYTGRNYLYGMAEINAADSSFQLYINANNGSKATHKYEFRIENGVGVCYETVGNGAPAKVSFTKVISHKCQAHSTSFTAMDGGVEMHSVNGKTYLEFMIPLSRFATVNANTYTVSSKTFTANTYGAYKYAVSATNNGKTLFHPDNSDVEGKTHSLWLTHYNADLSGGGSIINTLHAAQNTSTYYRAQFYFVPTQWEGIYKLDHYVESTSSQESVAVKIAELYPNGMPEGGFVYMSGSGNTTNNVDKLGITIFGLGYNAISVSEMIDALSTKEGSYVRFTGVDLETYRINTIYD